MFDIRYAIRYINLHIHHWQAVIHACYFKAKNRGFDFGTSNGVT